MAGLFLAYLYIQVYERFFLAIIDTRSSDIPMIWKPKQVFGKLGGVKIASFQARRELGPVEATWSNWAPSCSENLEDYEESFADYE